MVDAEDDEQFAIAHAAWRQFNGYHLELPTPTQPEIDGRLLRHRRAHETGAIRDFGAATVLLAGIGKAIAMAAMTFTAAASLPEIGIFILTCVLVLAIGSRSLAHLRQAMAHHGFAQRIGYEGLDWSRIDSMFADTHDPAIRGYIQGVRAQRRGLRRAEAAVALERGRGARPLANADIPAFRAHIRESRSGPSRREFATVLVCLLAAAATRAPGFDSTTLLPGLLLLGVWAFAELLGPVLQLVVDPWQLRGGGPFCQRTRHRLMADLVPCTAVVLVVIATAAGIARLAG